MKQLITVIKENFTRSDSVIKESMLVAGTEYLVLGTLFIVNFLVARYYGLGELGIFNFCYAIAQIAILGIGSSFSLILRRDLTLFPERQVIYVNRILRLRLLLLLITIVVVLPLVYMYKGDENNLLIFLVLMFFIKGFDLFNETYYTTYQSLQLYKKFSVLKSLNAFSILAIVLSCCVLKLPVYAVYVAMLAAAGIFFILNKVIYERGYKTTIQKEKSSPGSNKQLDRYLLKESWPLIANSVFYQISSRISVVLIFVLLGKEDAGLFSTGLIIVTVFSAASSALGIVLFPKINKAYNERPADFSGYIIKLSGRILLLGIVVYGFFLFIAPLIKNFFGKVPDTANNIYIIMGASIPFIFLAGVIGNIFTIIHRQRLGMLVALIILGLNIGILYLAIYFLKTIGFAIAFSIGNALQIMIIGLVAISSIKKMNVIKTP